MVNTARNRVQRMHHSRKCTAMEVRRCVREKTVEKMTDTPEKLLAFNQERLRYANQAVTRMVENSTETSRIVEWRGQLIQKVYPIYFDEHRPRSVFDFTSIFFSPVKKFMGVVFDTYYFNIAVIWSMTIFLYIALYFELLKKLVNSVEMWRKYSRKLVKIES
jgi:hypothetical protein